MRHLGLSEVSPDTLRAACAVHPIAALQSEWSLFTRAIEEEIIPTARELGVGIVPYSPLGRGELSGSLEIEAEGDFRRHLPRFQEGTASATWSCGRVRGSAEEVGGTPVQVALAWLLQQGDDVAPIPGTKREKYLEENAAAADMELTSQQLEALDQALPARRGDGRALPGRGHGHGRGC